MTNLGAQSRPAAAPAATEGLRPAKPPVDVPNPWAWAWWLGGALLLAAALLAWRRWRRQHPPAPPAPVPPHVRARQQLAEALLHLGDPKLFCTRVADTVRWYLEERFQLRAPERTTEEFLVELQSSRQLLPEQKDSLGQFLQRCDLVKFARFEPTEAALRELHDAALRLVDETQHEPVAGPPPTA
jgi:hypothetical protein